MSNAIPGVPTWLSNSHNSEHITNVLRALSKRERTRIAARTASRHQSSSLKRHKVAQIASSISTSSDHVSHYSISAGVDPSNVRSNRYADIHPYDRTRVVVCPGEPSHDCPGACASGRYLNANWVRELAGGKWWIATQAPLPHTAHAFLSVFLDGVSPPPDASLAAVRRLNRVRTVVQLTQNLEHGMRKAHVYFPPLEGQSWVIEPELDPDADPSARAPPIQVTLTRARTVEDAHCVQSVVAVQALARDTGAPAGEPVVFQHLLYAAWPDHGVPAREDREGLLRFARLVDDANRDLSLYAGGAELDPNPPIVVNCSAGVGRTGAFIALCSILRRYRLLSPPGREGAAEIQVLPPSPLGPLPEELQEDLVAQEIDALREQRPGMVQRDDQVVMIYETLLVAFAAASEATNGA